MITASDLPEPDRLSSFAPSAPDAALEFFGNCFPLLQSYAGLLTTVAIPRGVLGPREASRLWDRHLLNCGVLAEVIPSHVTVCDLGSGAGLPGLVLAIARPDLRVILLEPLLRRVTFLQQSIDTLGLRNVEVRRGRAEDHADPLTVDVVVARAVARLGSLIRLSSPLLKKGGELLAMKGESAPQEVTQARRELRQWAKEWSVVRLGEKFLEHPTTVVRVRMKQ